MSISLKQKIRKHLPLLEKYFLTDYKDQVATDEPGLMSGLAGIILLQSLFFQTTRDKRFKKELEDNIELLINNIEEDPDCQTTFCSGLAGIGWLFIYLNDKKLIEVDINDFLEEMDDLLETELEKMLNESNFDILHGSLGIGLYFLKRDKYQVVEKLINSLHASCEIIQNEIAWKRYDPYRFQKYIYDFGLAHGNVSILYFLGKCYQKKVLPHLCIRLINGGINFYLTNIQDSQQYGSYYPVQKPVDTYKIVDASSYSRFAWCYGDIGILHTLTIISYWIGNYAHVENFTSLLQGSINRTTKSQTDIIDACFCHGSSSVAYMYMNLYKITKNETYRHSSEYWVRQTLKFGNKKNNSPGYLFYSDAGGQIIPNLLNGLGGISLVYLSFLHDDLDNSWNEVFFLS